LLKIIKVRSHMTSKYFCAILEENNMLFKNRIFKQKTRQQFCAKLYIPGPAQEGKWAPAGSLVGIGEACWLGCFDWLLLIDSIQCSWWSSSLLPSEEKEVIIKS